MRRYRGFILLLIPLALLTLPVATAGAAPGSELWLHIVNPGEGLKAAEPKLAVCEGTGDVYVAGTRSGGGDKGDFIVARYTAAGERRWVRTYDRGGVEVLAGIAADSRGRVVLCGTQGDDKAMLIVKYGRDGDRLWARRLTTGGKMGARGIAIGTDDSIYIAGVRSTAALTRSTLCLVKYTPAGFQSWLRTSTGARMGSHVAHGPNGRVYVAGPKRLASGIDAVAVLRFTRGGVREWTRTFSQGDGSEKLLGFDVGRAGVCGTGVRNPHQPSPTEEGLVFRMGLDGTMSYVRGMPIPPDGTANGYACDMDMLGRVTVGGTFGEGFALWRFSGGGALLDTYDAGVLGDALCVAATATGDVYAGGWTDIHNGSPAYDLDVWTLGFSSAWLPLFSPVSHGSPTFGNDWVSSIVLASGCFYEAGVTDGSLLIVKYER